MRKRLWESRYTLKQIVTFNVYKLLRYDAQLTYSTKKAMYNKKHLRHTVVFLKSFFFSLKDDWRSWERTLTEVEISMESKLRQVMEHEESFALEKKELIAAFRKLLKGLDGIPSVDISGQDTKEMMESLKNCKVECVFNNNNVD